MAAGMLVLQPGEKDTQVSHDSDEVYFILKGDGFLKIKYMDYPISENKIYFVGKKQHFFHENSKELIVLYFFGGPDS